MDDEATKRPPPPSVVDEGGRLEIRGHNRCTRLDEFQLHRTSATQREQAGDTDEAH